MQRRAEFMIQAECLDHQAGTRRYFKHNDRRHRPAELPVLCVPLGHSDRGLNPSLCITRPLATKPAGPWPGSEGKVTLKPGSLLPSCPQPLRLLSDFACIRLPRRRSSQLVFVAMHFESFLFRLTRIVTCFYRPFPPLIQFLKGSCLF